MNKLERLINTHILSNQTALINQCLSSEDSTLPAYDDIVNLYDNDDDYILAKDVLEWHLITTQLASKLISLKEPVLVYGYNHWWGRTTTGQHISLDHVIEQLAFENM